MRLIRETRHELPFVPSAIDAIVKARASTRRGPVHQDSIRQTDDPNLEDSNRACDRQSSLATRGPPSSSSLSSFRHSDARARARE